MSLLSVSKTETKTRLKRSSTHFLLLQKSSSLQSKSLNHLKQININDEYGTPYGLFRMACEEYNVRPRIDICGSKANYVTNEYCDEETNCFTKEFNVDFFMNPPYSKVSEFMKFAYDQHKSHNVDVLILVYAKTDTKWWHEYVEGQAEIHFVKGRIKFNDDTGKPTKHSAPYPSVWIIYRKK